ncbi:MULTISPECIES: phospho-N-acetylmuramoyl-pentapeptide-transferase [Isoptericola]|uniref:Phospho-N-acetylmuramoyl-pentapeptide-transferase n=1 Tax=Isoptericola sediminis TaxID=2733572 RepID=A0A849K4D6_9MICO|nr:MULTISPECIES: phospho-N-acetylmuramoyl-pentapeptide-transferase [Isoptericola]MDO8144665.1 phospho-N-acetylmuramoyl-pentapeptide-transferase [Isoptericola sp. 178]MDO8148511.1 phospho-N-acetylmuramoyl-pentapeptide-transferase [Isoptericola sp. b515]MDO8151990.1 phospho-N-acetylmuramoyl-pentapeptide-transferase [Isoptericola sp. b408]NNU28198.1 phospho-N-acetylmuramoyl-pentapeptide-transferase [Isoptericola sediminis]
MIAVLAAAGVSLLVALLGTPLFIRFLVHRNYGQFVRQDGPTAHFTKRGTPTMGGVVIIAATLLGVAASMILAGRPPSASALLALYLMTGLGLVGFLDDFTKIRKQRSLGLTARAKIVGQGFVGISFAVLALQFPNANSRTPASTKISFLRDTDLDLAFAGTTIGLILFVIWANFLITAWSNAVNLTDGLDGLATGSSLIVFGAYVLVGIWQLNQSCQRLAAAGPGCYEVRDPQDLAIVAAAVMGACFGFLWWNASPAKIFMGDTGSLALGGALAALSILTRTEILAAIIGGLFVIIVLSDIIQIGSFKLTRKRVFKMAPLHHHFELSGWGEVTIVIRFWLIAGLFSALGMGIFYAEWVVS